MIQIPERKQLDLTWGSSRLANRSRLIPRVRIIAIMKTITITACCAILVFLLVFLSSPPVGSMKFIFHCGANFYKVHDLLAEYKNRHQGSLPPSLAIAVQDVNEPNILSALSSNTLVDGKIICLEAQQPYEYHPELGTTPSNPICWDPKPHSVKRNRLQSYQRRNVLFADGQVRGMSESEFQELMKAFPSVLSVNVNINQ